MTPRQSCRTRLTALCGLALLVLFQAGCREAVGLDGRAHIAVHSGDAQFGLAGESLTDQLQVRVTDPAGGHPLQGVRVDWVVTAGVADMTPAASVTDERGIATAAVRLGKALGTTRIRATAEKQTGPAASFHATAVLRPVITSISPAVANAGDTVTITGENFSTAHGLVLFDGISGVIHASSGDVLRVIVPPCVSTRTASVVAATGSVYSDAVTLETVGSSAAALQLARGDVRILDSPAQFQCVRLPVQSGASWLVIAQNAGTGTTAAMPFTLTALGSAAPSAVFALRTGTVDVAGEFEAALRKRERLLSAGSHTPLPAARVRSELPAVGSERAFNTIAPNGATARITAAVMAVTDRAILYRDNAAPAVFTTADFERFGELFDDPIYSTETAVFGGIGDSDGNERVIIVFTPQVNALTPRGSGAYIAGYFYACDLLPATRCRESNGGEIFYSMVPDPDGRFGDPHTGPNVLQSVPPVLAHELQHMISYGARGGTPDELWLSEGLAHSAEDIVADVLAQRGDPAAGEFRASNYANARRYLASVESTALVDDVSPGSVELRGGSWLLLRYLREHYGGDSLLRALTATSAAGTASIVAETGTDWSTILGDFAIAIYADGNPQFTGVALPERLTFPVFDVRTALSAGGFVPISVNFFGFADFAMNGALPPASQQYAYVLSPIFGDARLNMVFSGRRGGAFDAGGAPRLIVMRVR